MSLALPDDCPDENTFTAMIQGFLAPDAVRQIEVHLDRCADCMELMVDLAEIVTPTPAEGSASEGCSASALPKIGRYEVLHEVGSGAQGVVYAAFDPILQRQVAIKIVRPDRALRGDNVRREEERLAREARLLATIAHPNVLHVYEIGPWQSGTGPGGVFLVTELVSGGTLRSLAGKTWREIVAIWLGAARGLAAVHRAGLVHRDVKPDNILLHADGRAVLTDFGLASAAPRQQSFVGTPLYLAPELTKGARADARSDQYAFCVGLYEALHGVRPFAGATLGEIGEAAARGVIGEGRPSVPARVSAVVLRGLSLLPEQRYESMDHLVLALEQARAERGWPLMSIAAGGVVVTLLTLFAAMYGRDLLPTPTLSSAQTAFSEHLPSPTQLPSSTQLPSPPSTEISTTGERPVLSDSMVAVCDDFARKIAPSLEQCGSFSCEQWQMSALIQLAGCYETYGSCGEYRRWYTRLGELQPKLPVGEWMDKSYRCPRDERLGQIRALSLSAASESMRGLSSARSVGERSRTLANSPEVTSEQRETLWSIQLSALRGMMILGDKEAALAEADTASAFWGRTIDWRALGWASMGSKRRDP